MYVFACGNGIRKISWFFIINVKNLCKYTNMFFVDENIFVVVITVLLSKLFMFFRSLRSASKTK